VTTIVLDLIVLAAFIWMKVQSDMTLIIISAVLLLLIFAGEKWFLSRNSIALEN
jgi:hypothetical protein